MKKLLIFISILFLTLGAFAQANKTAQDYIESGKTKLEEGKFQEALKDFNKAIELDPNNAEAYLKRTSVKSGLMFDDTDILKDCNKALELEPNNPKALVNRGIIKVNLKKEEEAIDDFNKALELLNEAIRLDPNNAEFYSDRARAKIGLKQIDEGLEDLNKAIELDPKDSFSYGYRGAIKSWYKKEYNEAIEDYNKAFELTPNNVRIYYARGLAYKNLGEYKKALEDFNTGIKLNDLDSKNPYKMRVIINFKSGRYFHVIADLFNHILPKYVVVIIVLVLFLFICIFILIIKFIRRKYIAYRENKIWKNMQK